MAERWIGAISALCTVVWLASGCGGDDGPPDCGAAPTTSTTIEVGTGTVAFEPLSSGQELEVVAGPQGGFHFVVHARATGIVAGDAREPNNECNPRTEFRAFLGAERVDNVAPTLLGYRQDGADLRLPSGRFLTLDTETAPTLVGQDVRLEATITDVLGNQATSDISILAIEGQPL